MDKIVQIWMLKKFLPYTRVPGAGTLDVSWRECPLGDRRPEAWGELARGRVSCALATFSYDKTWRGVEGRRWPRSRHTSCRWRPPSAKADWLLRSGRRLRGMTGELRRLFWRSTSDVTWRHFRKISATRQHENVFTIYIILLSLANSFQFFIAWHNFKWRGEKMGNFLVNKVFGLSIHHFAFGKKDIATYSSLIETQKKSNEPPDPL